LHQLTLFERNYIDHIHFCLGYLGEIIKDVVEKSTFAKTMMITYSFDGDKLQGTGGAIKKALPALPDAFFVTYGDSYLDIPYESVESKFMESVDDNCGLMTVFKNSNKFDVSNVIYENNKIILYSKKQPDKKMEYIDYGLGILRKNHFDPYPENTLSICQKYMRIFLLTENL